MNVILGPCRCQGCDMMVYLARAKVRGTLLTWRNKNGRRHWCGHGPDDK